jgi:predicted nucleic acid-binding protein
LVLAIDTGAATPFDRLQQNKAVRRIGRGDQLIANIVRANGAVLVSRTLKDFQKVPGLKGENWVV